MTRSSQCHCVLRASLCETGYQMQNLDDNYLTVQAMASSQDMLNKPNLYAGHSETSLKPPNRSRGCRTYHGTNVSSEGYAIKQGR